MRCQDRDDLPVYDILSAHHNRCQQHHFFKATPIFFSELQHAYMNAFSNSSAIEERKGAQKKKAK